MKPTQDIYLFELSVSEKRGKKCKSKGCKQKVKFRDVSEANKGDYCIDHFPIRLKI